MKKSKTKINSVLFNVSGIAVIVTVVGYMAFDLLRSSETPVCSSRYPTGRQFSLEASDGTPLTPIELQGRAGLREWGLLQNASVVASKGGPAARVLSVNLATTGDADDVNRNGVSFVWPLSEAVGAKQACLSYAAKFPSHFKFKDPGLLPGLFGGAQQRDVDALHPEGAFVTRIAWGQTGDIGADVRLPDGKAYWQGAVRNKPWPSGRWAKIDQEIVLNTPGKADGILRLWVDNRLQVERSGIMFRKGDMSGLGGVVADVRYAPTASEPAEVQISPFVVRWR